MIFIVIFVNVHWKTNKMRTQYTKISVELLEKAKLFLAELDSLYDILHIEEKRAEALKGTYISIENLYIESKLAKNARKL